MARRSVESSVLTAEGLPVWSLPANATPDKKRAWERAMIKWVGDYLDAEHMEELNEVSEPDDFEVEDRAFLHADSGDYGPLRKLYPHLAPYLNPPRLGRGQKFPKAIEGHGRSSRARRAASPPFIPEGIRQEATPAR